MKICDETNEELQSSIELLLPISEQKNNTRKQCRGVWLTDAVYWAVSIVVYRWQLQWLNDGLSSGAGDNKASFAYNFGDYTTS